MQLLPEVLEGSRQKKIGKKQESCAGSMSSILLISYFSAFDPDHIEKLMFYSFFILVRVQLNTSQFAFFASLLIKQLNAFLNSFQCEIFVSYLSLVVPFILLLHSSRKQRTFLGILLILVLTFQIFLQIRVFLQYKAYLMQGEQISPWSMYKQKPGHTPFKFQHKILKKVQKNKIALPQIESSLQAIQMNVKKKLDLQQSSMLKRENNKNSTAMTSIHKIIQGKRKLSDEKLKNAAEQNFKVKRIDQEKESFQNQINSLLVFKMLYQQLKNQEENYHQKIQLKEEPVQMIKKPVQMIKSGSQALSNQKKAKNNELFAEVKCNRIHKLIQNISQDKLKEVLITQKISQRLRIIWQSKRKGHSTNK